MIHTELIHRPPGPCLYLKPHHFRYLPASTKDSRVVPVITRISNYLTEDSSSTDTNPIHSTPRSSLTFRKTFTSSMAGHLGSDIVTTALTVLDHLMPRNYVIGCVICFPLSRRVNIQEVYEHLNIGMQETFKQINFLGEQ